MSLSLNEIWGAKEIRHPTTQGLRLARTDTPTKWVEFAASTLGNLTITPFGGGVQIAGNLQIAGGTNPDLTFQPGSGATKAAQIRQQGNVLYITDFGVADRFTLDLGTGQINGGTVSFPGAAAGTYLGYLAGNAGPGASTYNTLLGYQTGQLLTGDGTTGGRWNTWGGFQVGITATSAYGNAGWGMQVHQDLTTGYDNTALGIHSQLHLTDGFGNLSGGGGSLQNGLHTTETVALGMYAGRDYDNDRGVFLGSRAGMYEDTDDTLMIDNQDRGSKANARSKAMFYGLFNADPAQQKLVLNAGHFFMPFLPTSSAGLTTGEWWVDSGTVKVA